MAVKKTSTGKKTTPAKKKTATKKRSAKKVVSTGHFAAAPTRKKIAPEAELEDDDLDSREKYMTLGDHLEELRIRILWMLGVLVLFSVVSGIYSSKIHLFLTTPYREITGGRDLFLMNVYGPMELLVKISILTGFTFAFPVLLFILWGFVTPAVSRITSILGHLTVAVSAFLFWGGIFFSWIYVIPVSLEFLFQDIMLPGTVPQLTLERYYSFVFMMEMAAGLVFQLPLILVILGALGILTVEFHKRIWRHVLVGIAVFAALITPPDPLSQVLFALPLTGLYALAVGIVWVIEKIKNRRRRKEDEKLALED